MTQFTPFSRDQAFLLPPDAKDWLPSDDVAHVVVAAVDRVPLGATSHSGRRTFITALAHKGAGVRVLASLAGHRSIATTQRYIDVNDEMKRAAVELISWKQLLAALYRTRLSGHAIARCGAAEGGLADAPDAVPDAHTWRWRGGRRWRSAGRRLLSSAGDGRGDNASA